MQERRRNKRSSLQSKLVMKRIDNNVTDEVAIEIKDVSRSGIGFACSEILQIGTIYESYLTIWTKEVLHAFLQIVRIEMKEDGYIYGASFVGLPEMDASRIDIYQTVSEGDN